MVGLNQLAFRDSQFAARPQKVARPQIATDSLFKATDTKRAINISSRYP